MTKFETGKIMAVLRGAYPNFYKDMAQDDALQTINLWAEMFADEPYELVAAAVKVLIAADEKGFPPHIGAVKKKIRLLSSPRAITESEAWALVAKAIKRSAYNAAEEFEKLPDDVKRMVGSPSQLKDWAMMDPEVLQSVVASNFQRSFRVRGKQDAEYASIPSEIKKMLQGVTGNLSLGGEVGREKGEGGRRT